MLAALDVLIRHERSSIPRFPRTGSSSLKLAASRITLSRASASSENTGGGGGGGGGGGLRPSSSPGFGITTGARATGNSLNSTDCRVLSDAVAVTVTGPSVVGSGGAVYMP